jgi:hypothetical protein
MLRTAVDVPNATGDLTMGLAVAGVLVPLLAADACGVEPAERIAVESPSGTATTAATKAAMKILRFEKSLLRMGAP